MVMKHKILLSVYKIKSVFSVNLVTCIFNWAGQCVINFLCFAKSWFVRLGPVNVCVSECIQITFTASLRPIE